MKPPPPPPRVSNLGHWPFVLTGLLLHLTAYALILINVPAEAPMGETYDDALLIQPSK